MDPITLINVRDDTIIDIDRVVGNEISEDQVGTSPDDSINQENIDEHFTKSSAMINIDDHKISEQRKPIMSTKKPPRPKRGTLLPLDAADERLIKETAELVTIRRARIKAMRKMKAAKASSNSSSSSSGNFIAMVFTVVFCIVMISQGCHSWRISPRNKSAILVPDSQMQQQNNSNSNVPLLINNVGSPNITLEKVHESDSKDEDRKNIRRN